MQVDPRIGVKREAIGGNDSRRALRKIPRRLRRLRREDRRAHMENDDEGPQASEGRLHACHDRRTCRSGPEPVRMRGQLAFI